jgi:competence protein ComEA
MRRTQDLVIARLRQIALRWRTSPPRATDVLDPPEPVPEEAPDVPRDAGLAVAADAAPHADAGPDPGPHPRVWLTLVGIVAVVVLLVGAAMLVRSWPSPEPIAAPARQNDAQTQATTPALIGPVDGFGAGTATPTVAASLVVHVVGEVRRPGVVVLPAGSRVADAVEAAGGLRRGAELGATNLARVLTDGERVEIGGDQVVGPASGLPGGAGPVAGMPLGLVDLNTATAEQLDSLPGIGPVTAAKILAWRAAHGRFSVVDELAEVPGIGPKTLAELRPHVRV